MSTAPPCGHPPPGTLEEMKVILSFYNSALLLPGLRSVLDRKAWTRFAREHGNSTSQTTCTSVLCSQGIVPCVVSPLFPGCTSCLRHNAPCSIRASVLEQTVARESPATASEIAQFRRAFQAHAALTSPMVESSFENILALLTQLSTIQKLVQRDASSSRVPEEFFMHVRRSIFAVAIGFHDRFLKIVSQDIMIHDIAAIVKDALTSKGRGGDEAVTRLHLLFLQREAYSHVWQDPTSRYGVAPQEPVPASL